ncbi:unnamed protein product [Callosobruchus maculatus]|uniref:Uncharacterized protein n=1 Tax=Callosobruchus maculatus TaxID=64391 RepID=A0A653C2H2_CALMS|nr:unnamed protein product [Callosobruchus maculatus]
MMGPRHTPPEHPLLFFATCSKSFNFEVWWHFMTSSVSRLINLTMPRTLDAEKEAIRHGISQKSTETCWKQWSAIFVNGCIICQM